MEHGPGKYMMDPSNKRGRNKRNMDPYVFDEGYPEPAVCTGCGAVYRHKRWYLKEEEMVQPGETTNKVLCPACQKSNQSYPEGIVTLKGDYLWKHEEEILNILRNTETNAMAKNPLERIMSIKPEGDALIVETTEEKLAEHIGRALNKAHHGNLNISWSDNHSFCRVTWERNESA
jgi:NMD protein affecting ribosome stability and mRNA decay